MKNEDTQKWLRLDGDDGWQIVIPDIDDKPHGFPDKNNKAELAWLDCPCRPKINYLDKIIVHNSFRDQKRIDESMDKLNNEK